MGESHSSRKDEVTDHLVNYNDTIDAYLRFLTSLLVNPIVIPMRVPLFVMGNVALDDHKCNHIVFWIFFPARQSVHEIEACKCPIFWQFGTFTIIIQWGNLDALYRLSIHEAFEDIIIKALEMSLISRAHVHKGGAGGGDDDEEEAHDEL